MTSNELMADWSNNQLKRWILWAKLKDIIYILFGKIFGMCT